MEQILKIVISSSNKTFLTHTFFSEIMSDIPNRLPAPEKRKDKINKNDMRYLYRIEKANERSKRRATIDEEIASEQKKSEKRRRQSTSTNHLKRLKKINQEAAYCVTESAKKGKKKLTPELILLQQSKQISWNGNIPCIFENDIDPSPWSEEGPMGKEEIPKHDPDAIIWYELGKLAFFFDQTFF